MTTTAPASISTVRDGLLRALAAAADFNPADVEAPIATLWPDADRAWDAAVDRLGKHLPVLRLGEYGPGRRQGPATFLRLAVAGDVESATSPQPPIMYLPGVSRRQLSDTESLPEELRPLAGLLVQSAVFAQRNGNDWTPFAFFTNVGHGLGLRVAADTNTKEALRRSLPRLLDEDLESLRGRDLTSLDFAALVVDDPVRDILLWLDDPGRFQADAEDDGRWAGFVSIVAGKFGVHPAKDGALAAGAKLGDRTGPWAKVWSRFTEAPTSYPGVPDVLRRSKPEGVIPLHPDSWPQDNDEAEKSAFDHVARLVGKPVADVRAGLASLRKDHSPRRDWVWGRLGQSPAAEVIERLATLADVTASVGTGATVDELAEHYTSTGWRVDDSFLQSLRTLDQGHPSAAHVSRLAESLYRPWLEATSATFQTTWLSAPPSPADVTARSAAEAAGMCVVFVDGLRFDVAAGLSETLQRRGRSTNLSWAAAAVPTVTSTCKPAVSPVAGEFTDGPELAPRRVDGQTYSQDQLKRALADRGWQFVPSDTDGDPSGRGWTEGGDIDTLGHNLGARLARQLPNQVNLLTARIDGLLAAGWRRVVVVTDHGWLLLPSKLPKHPLPEHLTVVRKGRCARLRDDVAAPPGISVLPWRWDPTAQIAIGPGIHAFEDGKVYEHGGISPQESVVPVLTVTALDTGEPANVRMDVNWVGLTLQVECDGAPSGAHVDIRSRAADASSSLVTRPKAIKNGKARLLASDEHEGEAVFVVLLNADGRLVTQQLTQIPEA
jgi:hypothetical protein